MNNGLIDTAELCRVHRLLARGPLLLPPLVFYSSPLSHCVSGGMMAEGAAYRTRLAPSCVYVFVGSGRAWLRPASAIDSHLSQKDKQTPLSRLM